MRVYEKPLSQAEIKKLYEDTTIGPKYYWPLTETSGTTAADAGTNYQLPGQSTPATLADGASFLGASSGGGVAFGGANDCMDLGETVSLNGKYGVTFAAWVRFDSFPGTAYLLSLKASDGRRP